MLIEGKYIHIRRDPPEWELEDHLIILPGDVRDEDNFLCTVLGIGPEVQDKELQVGDKIVVLPMDGVPVGDGTTIIHEEYMLGSAHEE